MLNCTDNKIYAEKLLFMKSILKTLAIACVLLTSTYTMYAQCGPGDVGQNIDIRFANESLDCANDKLLVDIQLSNPTGSDYTVGSMSLRFTVNDSMLNNPSIYSNNGIGTHTLQFQSGIYSYGVTDFTGTDLIPGTGSWTTVGTLEFDIINYDASGNANCIDLAWHTTTPAITTIQQWYNFLCQPSMTFTNYGNSTLCIADSCNTDPLSLSAIITNESCSGTNDGAIDLTIAGGQAPFTIAWSTGDTTEDVSGLAPGIYGVTVTDANGDNAVLSGLEVLANSLSVNLDIQPSNCNASDDGSITIDSIYGGVPPYTITWSDGTHGTNINTLTPGLYGLTVTDANGCSFSDDKLTITEPGAFQYNVNLTNVSCNGGNDGILDFTMSGGNAPYTYLWIRYSTVTYTPIDTLGTTEDVSGLEAGLYGVQVVDAHGCTGGVFYLISEPPPIIIGGIGTTVITPVRCYGESSGFIDVTTTGGTGVLSYVWSNGATSEDLDNEPAGTYSVTATDLNGCTATATFVITQPDSITVTVNVGGTTNALCYGDANGSVDITATGGTGPFSYNWSTGDTTQDLTGLTAGTYYLTVTDSLGCYDNTFNITITEPDSLDLTANVTNASCNGFSNGSIDLSVTGGTPGYAYSWSTGDSTQDISGLGAGSYTVSVTDTNGCSKSASFTVTQPNTLAIAIDSTVEEACSSSNNGKIFISVTGGTTPYSYLWSNGDTTEDISGLGGGTYIVTVTDANGCSDTASAVITQTPPLTITLGGSTNVSCNGGADGSININVSGGTPGYSYNWSNGDTTEDISGLTAGSYTVTVTDSRGCSTSSTFNITEPNLLVATISSTTDASCFGFANGSIDLSVTGGTPAYTYAWSNGDTTQDISGLAAGTYTVTVTDAHSCTATTSATITEPDTLTITVDGVTDVSCNGFTDGAIDISIAGGTTPYSYNWSNGDTTQDISGLGAGTYGITVTDAKGCSATGSITVSEPNTLVATITAVDDANCFGSSDGAIDLSVSGGTAPYSYLWSNGDTTQDISGLAAGGYTVTVTDDHGCTATATDTVGQPNDLTVSLNGSTDVNCNGESNGALDINVTGGTTPYSYSWSNGDTTQDITGLAAGTYGVTVTDAHGCTATGSFTVNEPDALTLTLNSVTDVTCNGANDGAIDLGVTGGTAPYSYLWSTGDTTQDISGLGQGTYYVTVTDAHGCQDSTSATINEDSPLTINLDGSGNVTCYGAADGYIDISATGGVTPYTYNWSTGDTTQDLTNLGPGSYSVTVTDSAGCSDNAVFNITQPDTLTASASPSPVICAGDSDGSVDLTVTGGTAPYTYFWNNLDTTQDLSGLAEGIYTVTVTDAHGCTATALAGVNTLVNLVINTGVTNATCGNQNGVATVTVTGGTGLYNYNWSTGDSTASVDSLWPGVYTVTVTDAQYGCTETATLTIGNTSTLVVTPTVVDVLCGGGATGSISLAVSGGSGAYSYNWSTGGTGSSITGLAAGTYSATITDDTTGCSATISATVNENSSIVLTPSSSTESCGQSDGSASVSPAGGVLPYTYLWSTGDTTARALNLAAGVYTVTVTDANGCTSTASVTVSSIGGPTVTIDTVINLSCAGQASGAINISVSGGVGPYTYNWSNGATTQNISGLLSGPYGVTVTDSNGCQGSAAATISAATEIVIVADRENVSCHGQSDGSIDLTVTGGVPPYTYNWSTGDSTSSISGLAAATYTVTVTDANGCEATTPIQITEPQTLDLSTQVTNVVCAGGSDGAIDLTVTGGTTPYTYNWSNGATTEDINNLTEGLYSVTVTDDNGCSNTTTVSVNTEVTLVPNTAVTNSTCGNSNGSATVSVSGGSGFYTYLWSTTGTTATINGLDAGTYTVTVVDTIHGCSITATVNVSSTDGVDITGNVTDASCGTDNGSIALTVTGGSGAYTYLWSNLATTDSIGGLSAGTYSVTVTDDSTGCTGTYSTTVGEIVALAITPSSTNEDCGQSNGSASVSVSGSTGPYTYAWSTGATTATAGNLSTGIYTVTVTDVNGCSDIAIITVGSNGGPTIAIDSVVDITCAGQGFGSISITASGGQTPYTYNWSNGATTDDISGLFSGPYAVTVTDANGCSASATATVGTATPIVVIADYDNVSCYHSDNGAIDISVSGGTAPYTYLWSYRGLTTQDISDLYPGNYTVTVTDANGCSVSTTITITEPDKLKMTVDVTNTTCADGTDGAVDATVTGGTPPYTYNWSNGATTEDLTGLAPGLYVGHVVDANGCTQLVAATVGTDNKLVINTGVTNATCGDSNGSACVFISGGSAPYTYAWGNGSTASCLTSLAPGVYPITVTDANGCSATDNVKVSATSTLDIAISSTDPTCGVPNSGTIDLTVTGGTGSYTYTWSPSGSGSSLTGLAEGTYNVTVTDSAGCSSVASITLTEQSGISYTASSTAATCPDDNGTATVAATGGAAPYTITWSNGMTTDTITGLKIGTYGFTIVDANGCSTSGFVDVTEGFVNTDFTASITDVSCGGGNGSIDLTNNTPYAFDFQWSTGDTTEDISNLAAGTYTLTLTDIDNCQDVLTFVVDDADGIDVVADRTDVDCNGGTGAIDVSVTGGITPYDYAWADGDSTEDRTGLSAGTYTVSVTDAGGCYASTDVLISEPDVLTITPDSITNVSCNGLDDGAIDISVTGGTAPYDYSWSTADTTQDISGLSAGSYSVTVTDAHGCTATDSWTISEPDPLTMSITGNDSVSCNGGSDGAASVAASGGTAPYSYEWSDATTDSFNTGLSAGTYWVIASDANGCTSDTTFITISEPAALTATFSKEDVLCNGGSTGYLEVNVSGGTAPFTYSWTPSGSGSVLNGIPADTYSVVVTDANGCSATFTDSIGEPDALAVTGQVTPVACLDSVNGEIDITVTGGTAPFTYLWSDNATTEDRTGLAEGTYYVSIFDANQCSLDSVMFSVGHNDCNNPPVAVDDTAQTREGTPIDIPVIDNDYDPDGDNISVTGVITPPSNGTTSINADGTINYTPNDGFIGVDTFTYVICDDGNPSLCDTAVVLVIVLPDRPNIKIPNSFSPNGDGINDYFEIVDINKFPDNELLIFNRWGNEVYRSSPYNNDWNGRNQDGEPLPDGTYFYILKINDSNGTPPYTGYVVVHRGTFN